MGTFSETARQPGSDLDWRVAELAGQQSGIVSREQLNAIGYSDRLIHRRCSQGRLHRIGPSVYSVGHLGFGRRGRAIAALLHTGPGAGISHLSAARYWQMVTRSRDGPIHVSIANRSRLHPVDGVVIHRPRTLSPTDLVVGRGGYRVTTPERTLRDQLAGSSVAEITRMLEQMVTVLGRSPDDLHAWARDLAPVRGRPKLMHALDEVVGPAVIRSEFESRFRTL